MPDTQTHSITHKLKLSLLTPLEIETNASFYDGDIAAIDYRRKRDMISQRIQLIIL